MKALDQIESGMAWIMTILLTMHLAGCDTDRPRFNTWRAKAALAIAEAEQSDVVQTTTRPGSEGTARTDERVHNEKSKNERNHRILYFGADSCPACRVAETSLERLAEAGWQVGPEPDNHIQTFTIGQTENEQLVAQQWGINAVPTWLLWENGEELERRTGPLDPFEIGRLFRHE